MSTKSAGILSPALTLIRSPSTSSAELISIYYPCLYTLALGGIFEEPSLDINGLSLRTKIYVVTKKAAKRVKNPMTAYKKSNF
jgi:hypothetical protein